MDRDDIVRICRDVEFGTPSLEDVTKLLMTYCIEKGKDPQISMKFVDLIINTSFSGHCVKEALNHYQSKYGVVRLYSAPNLNGVNTRKLLSIF